MDVSTKSNEDLDTLLAAITKEKRRRSRIPEWKEDGDGPYLYLDGCAVLVWDADGTLCDVDGCDALTLETLEEFCRRTRAWREERGQ